MVKYVLWRVGIAIPLIVAATIISFAVLQLIPGNAVSVLLFGSTASVGERATITAELGLNKPVVMQYLIYLGHLLEGNMGTSYINHESVAYEIGSQFGYTLQLAAGAMIVALAVGIPLGLLAARYRHSAYDRLFTGLAVLGVAVPYFWLGLLLVLLFSVRLHWLPALGTGGISALVLPAFSLGIGYAALIVRLFRANLIEELDKPYIEFARAYGVRERRTFMRAAVKASAGPTLTGIGIQFGNMLSGAAAIEVIFGRPGIGSLFVQAILNKDVPTIQGLLVLVTGLYILVNLLVDVTKAYLDPRVRLHLVAGAQ